MTIKHKVLISGDWGTGKSWLALSYSSFMPKGDMLSFDYEDGQEYYTVPSKELANPAEGLFYVRRVIGPSLYEAKAIIQKIINPQTPGSKLTIDRKPLDPTLLTKQTKDVMADIQNGKLDVQAICFDTITRLCELTTNRIFSDLIDRRGEQFAEKMSMLTWAKVKDDISELLYSIITEAQVPLILTAWAKNRFDQDTRQSTKDLIADVLKNVNAFVSLSLMLDKNPNHKIMIPRATVMKSRLRKLPQFAVLEKANWEAIFAAEPKFEIDETPVDPAIEA